MGNNSILRSWKISEFVFSIFEKFLGKIGHVKNRPTDKIAQMEGHFWQGYKTFDINDWIEVDDRENNISRARF